MQSRARCSAQLTLLPSDEVKPERIGRVLGIGLRVAGEKLAGTQAGAQQKAQSAGANPPHAQVASRVQVAQKGQTTKRLARGLGGFLRPFARVGGALWLEVTGVFFLLFALVFVRAMWWQRASALHGPDHWKFWGSAAMVLLFLYLAVSSFWRARRK